jgi:hypothetical protein
LEIVYLILEAKFILNNQDQEKYFDIYFIFYTIVESISIQEKNVHDF